MPMFNDELCVSIEFRPDWKKPEDYIIEHHSTGFTLYKNHDLRETFLILFRENFRIEIQDGGLNENSFKDWEIYLPVLFDYFNEMTEERAKKICDYENGLYFMFDIGKNFSDPNGDDSRYSKKYKDWFYFEFDTMFDDLYRVPGFQENLEKKGIEVYYAMGDWAKTRIFCPVLSKDIIDTSFNWYNELYTIAIQLQKKLSVVYKGFAKTEPWKLFK